METLNESTQAAAGVPSSPATAAAPLPPPSAPAAAGSVPANPFKAQIEQARKDWENIGKPKDEANAEQPPPPPKDDKSKDQVEENGDYRKILDAKNAAIKKAKSEAAQLRNRIAAADAQLKKADADGNEFAAALAQSKIDDLSGELAAKGLESAKEEYFANAERSGHIRDMARFRSLADIYMGDIGNSPAVMSVVNASKYPAATAEHLFNQMYILGWTAERLLGMPESWLKIQMGDIARESEAMVDGKGAPDPAQKPVPASVVATTSGDAGSEPVLKANGASMEDAIRHYRKYGAKGIM